LIVLEKLFFIGIIFLLQSSLGLKSVSGVVSIRKIDKVRIFWSEIVTQPKLYIAYKRNRYIVLEPIIIANLIPTNVTLVANDIIL
jgi:hypothetical protein